MKFILVTAAVLGAAAADNCSLYPASDFTNSHQNFISPPVLKAGLCGASWCDGNAQVTYDRTYSKAEEVCAAAGMRVPTYAELRADAAKGTGCGLDAHYVWSSTSCARTGFTGHLTWNVALNVGECSKDDASTDGWSVIRCVGENTASPTASPTGAPTTAEEGAAAALLDDLAAAPHVTGQVGDTVYKCMWDLCVMSTGADRGSWDLVQEADIPSGAAMGAHLEHDVTGGKFSVNLDGIQYVGDNEMQYQFPWTCACA